MKYEAGQVLLAGWLDVHLDKAIEYVKKNNWDHEQVKIVKRATPEFNDTMVLVIWKEK